jgi:hypothetical protein
MRIPPNLKNQKKLQKKTLLPTNLPDTWNDFVRLLKIKSGENYKQFKPYDYQLSLIDLCESESTILAVKSRQLGITQTIASYFLFKACKNPAYSAICFSRSQDDVSALSRRVRDMALQLECFGIETVNDNVGLIKLKGLGEIYFKNSSKEGSRSYDSISDFLFDEASFVPTIESIYSASSASSSMVSKSLKVIVSTPGSKLSWFYKQANLNSEKPIDITCKQVADGSLPPFYHYNESGLCKVFIHWKAHPLYSLRDDYLEYRQRQDQTSLEVINREYNLTFEEIEEHGIFNSKIIQLSAIETPTESPLDGLEYYLGIDTATVGDDYFVASLFSWDNATFKQCLLYRDRKKSIEFYLFNCSELIERFKPKCVSIETNSIGEGFYQQLQQNYPNIYFNKIHTSSNNKSTMIGSLQVWIESKKLTLLSDDRVKFEFLNFVRIGQQLRASNGHDDIVMSSAFCLSGLILCQNKLTKPSIIPIGY